MFLSRSHTLKTGEFLRKTPGIVLWLDAADYNTFTFASANRPSQWRDKSGNGNHANEASAYPTYDATAIGGKPGVWMKSSDAGKMTITDNPSLNYTSKTVFCVAKLVAATSTRVLATKTNSGTNNREWQLQADTGVIKYNCSSAGTSTDKSVATTYTATANVPFVFHAKWNGAYITAGVNHGSHGQVAATAIYNGNQDIIFGTTTGGTADGDCYISEWIEFNRALTGPETKRVLDYLSAKWGVAVADTTVYDAATLLGQSNPSGQSDNADLPALYDTPYANIQIWDVKDTPDAWDDYDPADNSRDNADSWGPDASWAYWHDQKAITNPLYFVKYCDGGTHIANDTLADSWYPGTGTVYAGAQARIDAALAALDLAGVLYDLNEIQWWQGESDCTETYAPLYANNLRFLIASLRAWLYARGYAALNVKFIMAISGFPDGTGSAAYYPYLATVRAAQQAVAASEANVRSWDTIDLTYIEDDELHVDPDGSIEAGKRMSDAAIPV